MSAASPYPVLLERLTPPRCRNSYTQWCCSSAGRLPRIASADGRSSRSGVLAIHVLVVLLRLLGGVVHAAPHAPVVGIARVIVDGAQAVRDVALAAPLESTPWRS